MRIREAMNTPIFTCAPELRLQEVARLMIQNDCGFLPVAETDGRLVGVLTDRDVCREFARRGGEAADAPAHDVMTAGVLTCSESDDVESALELMGTAQVRRLPVVDDEGRLCGILSMDDVVLRSQERMSPDGIAYSAVVGTLRNLCSRRTIAGHAPTMR